METLETLGKRIATTKGLQSIVRTMKSLSAVSIRQYERAVAAQTEYNHTIELGLQVLLRAAPLPDVPPAQSGLPTVAIVFGSDHGLCGRFNEQISRFAHTEMEKRNTIAKDRSYLAIGVQAASRLEAMGERIDDCFNLPGAVTGLKATAHAVLLKIDTWQTDHGIGQVLLFHNVRSLEATASPVMVQLLPLDVRWLRNLSERRWPSHVLPIHTIENQALFSSLIREHLFISIFRAGAESMASEHARRLASMQAAERNIQENLEEMSGAFRRRRQQAITEELLDVVAGFESLRTASGTAENDTDHA